MAAQVGLCLAWSETPEDTFCHDEAHFYLLSNFDGIFSKVANCHLRHPDIKVTKSDIYMELMGSKAFCMNKNWPFAYI